MKEVVAAMLMGGSFGCWFFFGTLESYSMHQFMSGAIDVAASVSRCMSQVAGRKHLDAARSFKECKQCVCRYHPACVACVVGE